MNAIPRDMSPEEVQRAVLVDKTYSHLNGARVHFETEHGTEIVPLVDVLRALGPKDDENPDVARPGQWEQS